MKKQWRKKTYVGMGIVVCLLVVAAPFWGQEVDRPFQGASDEDVTRDFGPEIREESRFSEGTGFRVDPFRSLYSLEDGIIHQFDYGPDGLFVDVESSGSNRTWRYMNLFDDGSDEQMLREYDLDDVADNRDNIRDPDTIESALLCREEATEEFAIIYLDQQDRPVHALSAVPNLRVLPNIARPDPPAPCTFDGTPELELEIATDTETFDAVIESDAPDEMPEMTFEVDSTIPAGPVMYEWALTIRYDEGNYGDFAEGEIRIPETGFVEIQGDTSWTPDFEDEVMGGTIEVEVRASLGNLEADTSKNGFQVKGENPEDGELVTETPGTGTDPEERRRGRLAMVWKESSGRQFDAFDQTPSFPLIGDDDPDDPDSTYGWGLTQLTLPEPTRQQVWDWVKNLEEGIEHFDGNYDDTLENVEGWHGYWENPPDAPDYIPSITTWEWSPNNVDDNYLARTDAQIQDIQELYQNGILTDRVDDQWPDGTFETRDTREDNREQAELDEKAVSRVLNMQGYLQFNAGATFPAIVDEFGIIRRRIAPGTWDNVTGYAQLYDNQPWE